MPNLQRDFDLNDFEWEQTGFAFTFARLQHGLLQRIAQGENLIHPQHIEIIGEQDPFFPRLVRLADGFLIKVLHSKNGTCLFVLHADEIHASPNGILYMILHTVVVEFCPNGMIYIKTYSKIADSSVVDDFINMLEPDEAEEGKLIALCATGA